MLATFWEFNIGHVITLAIGVAAWAISLGVWKSEHETLKKTVIEHSNRLNEIDRTGGLVTERDRNSLHDMVKDHELRIRNLETIASKIDVVANDMNWMKKHILKAMRIQADENL